MTRKKTEPVLGDDFDLFLSREVLLMAGGPNTGKSYSVARLIEDSVAGGYRVDVIDRDRGLGKALKELGLTELPPSVRYTKASTWADVEAGVQQAMELGAGDWVVLEMMGEFWNLSQTAYSEMVYGEGLTSHILALRAEAEAKVQEASLDSRSKAASSERQRGVGYQGMEGRTDWSLIKRMHNTEVRDRLIENSNANILATTAVVPLDDERGAAAYPKWKRVGVRPEGEKHNVYKFDTWVYVEFRDGSYVWSTDLGKGEGKDRGGRAFATRVPFDDTGLIMSMNDHFGAE
ncbi:hypothetical protein LCGC14_0457970 [marine sediment metagenome]|uniref:Uncharacterized protein n=1 Tax=marine sediment metagenome TaxID=412755 RepID=A0A0F9SL98_9ZZZZ